MKRVVVFLVGVLVLAAAWFFVSPLFIDRAVDEEFLTEGGRVDLDKLMAMSSIERDAKRQRIMDAASAAPDETMAESMPSGVLRVLAQGRFVDADIVHKGTGRATLYELPDGSHVVRFEDFRTTNGPALVVYMARHPSPTSASDVTDEGYLSLGKLKGNVGNQNYPVPRGTDVAEYNSVVIWCELFNVLFSPAALTRP